MTVDHNSMANAIRALSIDAVEAAKSGHPGMPMGFADAATVLWTKHLKYDAADPEWPDRDRFVLSAGHGSMLIYSLLHLTGFAAMTMDEIRNFRQLHSKTAGHPECGETPGVEVTTGMLGQGFANAVGMAIAEKKLRHEFGPELVDHRIWCVASDGDLMEGVSHEAAALAGTLGLNRLIVLWDDNDISIDGRVSIADRTDQRQRFRAYGWATWEVDGHDPAALDKALSEARTSDKPAFIAVKTIIGYGAPNKKDSAGVHGSPLGPDEAALAKAELGWTAPPFTVPEDILGAWREAGARGAAEREAWSARLSDSPRRGGFLQALAGGLTDEARAALEAHVAACIAEPKAVATRQASGEALEALVPATPFILGGSADLTGSVNTKIKSHTHLTAQDFSGGYIHYGVREHAMAAAMNGMAAHGGILPYAGTFMVFTDYARPAIRMAALMGLRCVFVMTHDSIGLGEDGPTHQPVEHLAAMRAIPGLKVIRPCDRIEAAEAWADALAAEGPSVIVLSRQGVPQLRAEPAAENLTAKGAYVLRPCPDGLAEQAALIGTGTETHLAVEAQALLAEQGIGARVISMPSWDAFERQSESYQREVLPAALVCAAIEAAGPMGWERWTRGPDRFVGMHSFGASAPAKDLYAHFGVTAQKLADLVRAAL